MYLFVVIIGGALYLAAVLAYAMLLTVAVVAYGLVASGCWLIQTAYGLFRKPKPVRA